MKLDEYLSSEKITDADFADQIGRVPSSVWRLRKGQTLPDWETVRAIHDATGGKVSANDFLPAPAISQEPATVTSEAAQ